MACRLLVTGGAGFIGSHLVEELVFAGHTVRVLDNLSTGRRENLGHVSESVELIVGDIRDPETVRRAMSRVQVAFHLAALPSVQRSWESPLESLGVNAHGTAIVAEAAVRAGCESLIYSSSSSVYGDQAEPAKAEELKPQPISPYGYTKLMGEKVCLAHSREGGIRTVALRYFNVFGPRQDPASEYAAVIPRFITQAMKGTPVTVYGDGRQRRDFTHVRNVVSANLKAFRTRPHALAVNVACGRSASILDLIDQIGAAVGRPLDVSYAPSRPGDIRESVADLRRAGEALGYSPEMNFEEGLRDTYAWYAAR